MKKPLLLLLLSFTFLTVTAQNNEFHLVGYTTLMHFSGASATSASFINRGVIDYTNNPYGNKNGESFGVAI